MKLVLDIETQNSFKEVGGKANLNLLKISLVVVYSYFEKRFLVFMENELDKLGELIKKANLVIGFNLYGFDYPVLENYLKDLNFNNVKALDIMYDIQKYLGYKVKLDSVAQATLGTGKSGSGLEAIDMWRKGQIEDLKKYCLKDVEITRDIYEYGIKNKKVKFKSLWQKYDVPIDWS